MQHPEPPLQAQPQEPERRHQPPTYFFLRRDAEDLNPKSVYVAGFLNPPPLLRKLGIFFFFMGPPHPPAASTTPASL